MPVIGDAILALGAGYRARLGETVLEKPVE
jgi:hypothetical protein